MLDIYIYLHKIDAHFKNLKSKYICHPPFYFNSIYHLQLPILYDAYSKTISNGNCQDFTHWLSVRKMLWRWPRQSQVSYPKTLKRDSERKSISILVYIISACKTDKTMSTNI